MAKTHMKANKGITREPFSLCASAMRSNGKVFNNGRRSYRDMASPIVPAKEFVATKDTDRCAHCVDVLRQRKEMFPKTFAAICEA